MFGRRSRARRNKRERPKLAAPWTSTTKDLKAKGLLHAPLHAVVGPFSPPPLSGLSLAIGPPDLFRSIARSGATSRGSTALVAAMTLSAKAMFEFLIDDVSTVLGITDEVFELADAERTALSGRIGAGIADLVMDALGYSWRDLAEEVIAVPGRLADFAYDSGTDVVLAEAKGSISAGASASGNENRALRAYKGQVDPHIFTSPPAPRGHAPVGLIAHGYASSVSGLPGSKSSPPPGNGADAFLAVAQTDRSTVIAAGGTPPTSGGGLSGVNSPEGEDTADIASPTPLIALGNYRAVFRLSNAPVLVQVIESFLASPSPTSDSFSQAGAQSFDLYECGGVRFIVGSSPIDDAIVSMHNQMPDRFFAVAEPAALSLFSTLQVFSQKGVRDRNQVAIQRMRAIYSVARRGFVMSPDGLALLERKFATPAGKAVWSPWVYKSLP